MKILKEKKREVNKVDLLDELLLQTSAISIWNKSMLDEVHQFSLTLFQATNESMLKARDDLMEYMEEKLAQIGDVPPDEKLTDYLNISKLQRMDSRDFKKYWDKRIKNIKEEELRVRFNVLSNEIFNSLRAYDTFSFQKSHILKEWDVIKKGRIKL